VQRSSAKCVSNCVCVCVCVSNCVCVCVCVSNCVFYLILSNEAAKARVKLLRKKKKSKRN